ncbi:MAG TPA: hypothetical protein VG917_02290 [Patescibacteria group bacterium]|nr:hypothetical protein [Patescibacteria group bacterium]
MSYYAERQYIVSKTIRDTQGRPFDSRNNPIANPFINRLPGREGVPTDMEAFQEFLGNKDDVHSLTKYIRRQFPKGQLLPPELETFCYVLHGLPLYLALRARNPIAILQPVHLDTARAANGVRIVANHIWEVEKKGKIPHTAHRIYEVANGDNKAGKNFFVDNQGKDPRSCPAPKTNIEEMLEIMLAYPRDTIDPSKEVWGREIPNVEEVRRIIQYGHQHQALVRAASDLRETTDPKKILELNTQIGTAYKKMDHALGR